MLNILPAIMLLLVQGMGDADPAFRCQHALLDLAQRVGAAQSKAELQDLLSDAPGLDAHQIASWIDVFLALKAEVQPATEPPEAAGREPTPPPANEPLPAGRSQSSDRTRDGPSF
ncbi:MAG: hypothetical protein IH945_09215 [Armatimonadetes bacterium]|nr:hypothetical protein [Armatimonadota bacterium]